MPETSPIRTQLSQAWARRFNQQIDECRLLLEPIRTALGLPKAPDASVLSEVTEDSGYEATSYVLLCASLARAEGKHRQAKEWISMVDAHYSKNELSVPYHLPLQKGLTLFVDGDYSQALEQFLLAKNRAEHPTHAMIALANAVLCLENLGLPFEKTLEDFRELFRKEAALDATLVDIRNQLEALEMRRAFRSGDMATAFSRPMLPPVSQATYYRLWLSELPFHRFHSKLEPTEMECFLVASPYFHQKSFRLRTLQGLVHEADRNAFRPSEMADRLYLWTWRWLTRPEVFPADRVTGLFQGLDFPKLRENFTAEDAQMFRNALLWLALFLPARTGPLKRLALSLRSGGQPDYPVYDFEFQVLDWLVCLREGKTSEARRRLKELKTHAQWNNVDLHLAGLVESLENPEKPAPVALEGLAAQLRILCRIEEVTSDLTVDLAALRLTTAKGEDVLSEPMCLAFELLHGKPCVEVAEFALVCFGLTKFDAIIHNPKVFNLLARMKSLKTPGLTFQLKSGRIYAQGSWEKIRFVRPHGMGLVLEQREEWNELFEKKEKPVEAGEERWVKPSVALKQAEKSAELTREEIERLTGKSRSTATRLLNRWLKEGILKKVGKAKNTRYVWVGTRPAFT